MPAMSGRGGRRSIVRPIVDLTLVGPTTLVVLASAAVLGVLALRFGRTTSAGWIDARADHLISRWFGEHAPFLRSVVHLGDTGSVVAIALSIALGCLLIGRYRLAVLAVCGPGITGAATSSLQPLIGRTFEGGFALPSGHAGGSTALVTVLGLVGIAVAGRHRPRRSALLAVLAIGILSSIMSIALVANDEHYWTDTVAGSCTALIVVLGLALIIDRALGPRRSEHSHPPSSSVDDGPKGNTTSAG